MIDVGIFMRLAAVPAAAFLVFLNFLGGVGGASQDLQPPVFRQHQVRRNTVAFIPNPQSRITNLPTSDRTRLGSLPSDIRSLAIPEGLPRPLPTSTWWSSGVLESFPAPLFPWPLKITMHAGGIDVTAPGINVIETAVMHAPVDILAIRPEGLTLSHARPLRWGDWDITYRLFGGGNEPVFDVTAAQGSPFVFLRSYGTNFAIALPAGTRFEEVDCAGGCGRALVLRAPQRTYLLTIAHGGSLEISGAVVRVQPGGLMSIAAVAAGSDVGAYVRSAMEPVEETSATFAVLPDRIETTFRFPRSTLIGLLPHQQAFLQAVPGRFVGRYETVRGTLKLYEGSSFTTEVARPPVIPGLPPAESLARDSAFQETLTMELQALQPVTTGDVYAAAKQVLRAAHLADLAVAFADDDAAMLAVRTVYSILADWCTDDLGGRERTFAFDRELGGLIPLPPAFGSEHYNDHHFHAGYFLAAGATVARLDPSFIGNYGDCMEALIRDIANTDRRDPSYPTLRHFDVYAGHSWANGLTLFADAHNQESTSEALQAWHAIALWGRVTENRALEDLGTWLMAQEAVGAQAYWFNALPGHPTLPSNFSKPMASIVWGGKADYATFFDANPTAIHGIQFFPVTTALLASVDPSIVSRLATPLTSREPRSIWTSTLTLVSAFGGQASSMPETDPIDAVLSRSYVTQWLRSLSELGSYNADVRGDDSCGVVFGSTAVVYRYPGMPGSCTLRHVKTGKSATVSGLSIGWNVRSVGL